jgi:hypothetical protein
LFGCFVIEEESSIEDSHLFALLNTMDILIREDSTIRSLFSDKVANYVSQLSLIGECIHEHSIWYETPAAFGLDRNVEHSHDHNFTAWLQPLMTCRFPVHLINPARGQLRYPVHKARNRGNVQLMRAAEANVDRFWEFVDTLLEQKSGIAQHDIIRQCMLEGGQMQCTPPWEEPMSTKPTPADKPEYVYQPFSRIFHTKAMQIAGAFDRLAIEEKVKQKTKGSMTAPLHGEPAVNIAGAESKEETEQQ